jgi:hypothetical protein
MRLLIAMSCLLPLLASADDGWRGVMRDVDEPSIDAAHQRARGVLAQLPADAYGREDVPQAEALLQAPSMPTADHQALLGRWRCRSIQVDRNGVFAYPAFRCEIRLTEDGTLEFTKTSGSQRRHGQIYPSADRRWVFLGGQSVNDEPYRVYSGTLGGVGGADLEFDSVGLVETLEDGRVRMILDASDQRVEFYELMR